MSPNTGRKGMRKFATVGQLVAAFLLSGVIASASAYYAYNSNSEQDRGQTLATCLSGGEFRILVAQANDTLRRSAVGLVPGEDANPRVEPFLKSTQPAIDSFLSQAAGEPYSAGGTGEVTQQIVDNVRALSVKRCERRSNASAATVTSPR